MPTFPARTLFPGAMLGVLAFVVAAAPAQDRFRGPADLMLPALGPVQAFAVVDLNLDGVDDLLLIGTDSVATARNNGAGQFALVSSVPLSVPMQAVVHITPGGISTNSNDRFNFVLMGATSISPSNEQRRFHLAQCALDGTGLRLQTAPFATSTNPRDIFRAEPAQLDSDPELEVVVPRSGVVDTSVPANLDPISVGPATLTPLPTGYTLRTPQAVHDFNQDGFTDLLIQAPINGLDWLLGDGVGGFNVPVIQVGVPPSVATGAVRQTNFIDTDGDTRLDFVEARLDISVNPPAFQVSIAHGQPDGTFAGPALAMVMNAPQDLTFIPTGGVVDATPEDLLGSPAGDLNLDGQVFENLGNDTFRYGGELGPLFPVKAVTLDLGFGRGAIGQLPNAVGFAGGFVQVVSIGPAGLVPLRTPDDIGGYLFSGAVDLDGDGYPELVSSLGIERNDGTGRFAKDPVIQAPVAQPYAVVDWDLDGDEDVLLAQVSLFVTPGVALNDGAGNFTPTFVSFLPARVGIQGLFTLSNGDLTQAQRVELDGDPRVETYYPATGSYLDVLGPGQGAQLVALAAPARDAVFADLNGDGNLDLLTSRPELLLGDGLGGFTDATVSLPALTGLGDLDPTHGSSVEAGDVDGDGLADAVLSGHLLLQQPGGALVPAPGRLPVASTPTTQQHCLVDLDRDGDLDWCWVEAGARAGRAFLNDGSGFFTEVPFGAFPNQQDIWTPLVVDVDRDGDLDIAWTAATNNDRVPLTLTLNQQRHLTVQAVPRLGTVAELLVADLATTGGAALLGIGTPAPAAIPLPEGRLWIDPSNLLLQAVPQTGPGAVRIQQVVPNVANFLGLDLVAQAFMPAQLRLSNAVRVQITQ